MKIFLEGKKEAEKMALFLEESERILGKSLVILQCDGHAGESTYVRLKREMGERLGVMITVLFAKNLDELRDMVANANNNETVDGILVQLPINGATEDDVEEILCSINPMKDIDGLNPKSRFIPAAVRATERVMEIFNMDQEQTVALVGSLGRVGKRMMERFLILGYEVTGFDKGDTLAKLSKFDIVISATGVGGLIKEDMVKEGFVGIDLGYPTGDFSKEAFDKANKITPVPGGVGPLTVVSLYENLAEITG